MAKSVAVVIPLHDRFELVVPTLRSVLEQTVPAAEVIVVDDGSAGDARAALAPVADERVRVIRVDNGGPLVARNVGTRAARAELVAYCDSDDLWRPTYLEAVAALWERRPGLSASYGNFSIVRDGWWERDTKFGAAPRGFWDRMRKLGAGFGVLEAPFAERLIDYQPFFPSGMVVDRCSFLAGGGWDEAVSRIVGCDFATALRAAERPPVGIIEAPLVGIRKHGANISGDIERMNLGNARVLEHVLATRPSMARWEGRIRASIAERRRAGLAAAFARGDRAAVGEIYRLLPAGERGAATRLKAALAAAPGPLAPLLSGAALRLGSSRSTLARWRPGPGWGFRAPGGVPTLY